MRISLTNLSLYCTLIIMYVSIAMIVSIMCYVCILGPSLSFAVKMTRDGASVKILCSLTFSHTVLLLYYAYYIFIYVAIHIIACISVNLD